MTIKDLMEIRESGRGIICLIGPNAQNVYDEMYNTHYNIPGEYRKYGIFYDEPERKVLPSDMGETYDRVCEEGKQFPNTKVVIATWSPLFLDNVEPDDIYYCGNSITKPFVDKDIVGDELDYLTPGEIWTNHDNNDLKKW